MEFDEIFGDEMAEPFEDDLEEFERNQVAADHEGEAPLGHAIEEGGELLD